MAKKDDNTIFLCNECGYESARWLGCCPSCGTWNSLKEYTPPKNIKGSDVKLSASEVQKLSDINSSDADRISTGIGELDRTLGGGMVRGMAVLLGGDPGIGKSTLLMQAASNLSKNMTVLYVTGEESAAQLKLRADRLNACGDMLVLAENDLETILKQAQKISPAVMIIDSIQTMQMREVNGTSGGISQIREATATLLQFAKANNTALFIVGHVTKDGAIAGPKSLEHMVDTVLYFEGDRHDAFRLLRAVKNRFGSTNEIGVFEMSESGMREVADPSSLFITGNTSLNGCVITVALEGTRPIMAEVQALVSSEGRPNPRRMATGLDTNRLMMLLAVLEQKAGLRLMTRDVYVNAVGGIRLYDRANDLALCSAVMSAYNGIALPQKTVILGEVGLTGELRPISRAEARLNECIRLGFETVLLPSANMNRMPDVGINIITARSIAEAMVKIGMTDY